MSTSGNKLGRAGTPGIMTVELENKQALFAAYMPFIKNGGLFINTRDSYVLGEEVFALLHLQEQEEKLPVAGKVVWVTPRHAQGKRYPGIGIQFSPQDNGATQKKIETIIAGMQAEEHVTNTM
ncbi:MAG: PilZ domain-containing protein [Salinisphaeraceae bacterium]|nr:PilZ domain-containing protein [Salinisphaeraceae bacterium]